MADYAYIADRARRVFSSLSKLESDYARSPQDVALQVNLASMRKMAEKARIELERLAEINSIEVCQYRLVPQRDDEYALANIARSYLSYQGLFSQIYDAFKNGPKERAVVGAEAERESTLDFGYTYNGSLGVTLLARSERDFFNGTLDRPIDTLYQVLEIDSIDAVKDIAHALGRAVVKRIHDWSEANVQGGYSTDIRWKRSDGRLLGQMVAHSHLASILGIIDSTADATSTPVSAVGMLVAASLPAGTFHLTVPGGESYVGHMAGDAEVPELTLGKTYQADMVVGETYFYATERRVTTTTLRRLTPFVPPSVGAG